MGLAGLERIWAERDDRYSRSRDFLTDSQVASVRDYRVREAKLVDDPRLVSLAREWTKPPYVGSRGPI